jgi:iron complex transport system substrate-binding protein
VTRICSLLPSATEIVASLGLAGSLVGRSQECDWPDEVLALPVVTAARIDTNALTSLEVDEAVRAAVAEGRSLYAIDEELIRSLAPDVIVTQDLCEVCAVSSRELRGVTSLGAEVISLDARTIEGIAESVAGLADRLGVPERGKAVVAELRDAIEEVAGLVAGAPRRRVFVAEWLEPPYAAGHWVAVDALAYYSRPAPRIAGGIRQLAFLLHPDRAPDPGLPWIDVD